MEDNKSKNFELFGNNVFDFLIRIVIFALIFYWCLDILGPFLVIIIWSCILAIALFPAYEYFVKKINNGFIASSIIVLLLLLAVIIPIISIGGALIENIEYFAKNLSKGTFDIPPPNMSIKEIPLIGVYLYNFWFDASENLSSVIIKFSAQIKIFASSLLKTLANVGIGFVEFIVAVFFSGFIFGWASNIRDKFIYFAKKTFGSKGVEFIDLAKMAIRNVAVGVLGVALVQAILAGFGMIMASIPAAGFLSFLVLIFSTIQVGPGIVLIPVIIYGWMSLDFFSALIFTFWMVPVMLFDNVMKPIVMSRGLSTPMLVIFIGVIGGTIAHGLIGLFIGPVILALGYEFLVAWGTGKSNDNSN